MSAANEPDITEAEIIKAIRMVADGSTWREVVDEIYPDAEYPELLETLTCARCRYWYRQQTPEYLREVLR